MKTINDSIIVKFPLRRRLNCGVDGINLDPSRAGEEKGDSGRKRRAAIEDPVNAWCLRHEAHDRRLSPTLSIILAVIGGKILSQHIADMLPR